MPSGTQIWDGDGRLILDTNQVIGLIFGRLAVAEGQMSGSISNEKFAYGKPFALPFLNFTQWVGANRKVSALTQLKITFSGTTMSWSRVAKGGLEQSAPAGVIHYGIYSSA